MPNGLFRAFDPDIYYIKTKDRDSFIMKTKVSWKHFFLLNLGSLLMAVGVYFFKFPNNFSFGGVTGLAVIISKLFAIMPGDFSFIANMTLLGIGFLFLGKSFAAQTAYTSILVSALISMFEHFLPLSGPLTDDALLELIFAIALPAAGSAILFNIGASSGGTDVIAMLLKKYTSINIGNALLATDALLVVGSFLIFDVKTGLFSVLGLTVKSFLVDSIIENINLCKYFNVVCTEKGPICDFIVNDLHRSATVCEATGAFTGTHKYIVFTVLNRMEAVKLRNYIRTADPSAFILITNTSEIIGKGFHSI